MYPVLFTLGSISVTSFGVSLSLAFFAALFVVWRLSVIYELDRERVIDLMLISFFGGLIFARLYYVVFHLEQFTESSLQLGKVLFFNKYPGLSFWGALIGVFFTALILIRRSKLNYFQVADIGIVAGFIALSIGSLGCFFGGCQYGLPSGLPIAVEQIGIIEKRFPLQIVEALFYFFIFYYLWKNSLKFHFNGKIFALGLVLLGTVKFILEFYRGDRQIIYSNISPGSFFSMMLVLLGLGIYYKQGKRSILSDLRSLIQILVSRKKRKATLFTLKRRWYNFKINWKFTIVKVHRNFLRRINVRSNPPKI